MVCLDGKFEVRVLHMYMSFFILLIFLSIFRDRLVSFLKKKRDGLVSSLLKLSVMLVFGIVGYSLMLLNFICLLKTVEVILFQMREKK